MKLTKQLLSTALVVAFALPLSAADPKPKAKEMAPPAVPAITRLEPRGIQRGMETRLKLVGSNLAGLTNVTFHNPKLTGALLPDAKAGEAWLKVTAAADLTRGSYELSVKSAAGESARVKLHVDDLRQATDAVKTEALPVGFWGALEQPGKAVEFSFNAVAGQNLVCDLAAERLGSKAVNAMLTLLDERGRVLAVNRGFDGRSDALLVHRLAAAGRYTLRVSDLQYMASPEHFFRVSVGELPVVTGVFPLAVPAEKETEVQLTGENLPPGASAKVKAGAMGEVAVPVDAEKFRARKEFKVLVGATELVEVEPNNSPASATSIQIPGAVNGRLTLTSNAARPAAARPLTPALSPGGGEGGKAAADSDYFRFEAKKGQRWVIETMAARRGSPADTKIEVLHADGRPVERVWLQAVRDSSVTFRGIDSNNPDVRLVNWEEMELNQFLYFGGEVCRLFRAPRGPDAGFLLYNRGGRLAYFDTSPVAHPLDEPAYIIEPYPPGAQFVPNGLPLFKLTYANDDDGERKLGTDSRLNFSPPAAGSYLVRVTESKGFGGDRYAYRLIVREAKPDFTPTLTGANQTIPRGSGRGFSVKLDRVDGFEGAVRVDVTGMPKGWLASTPLVVEAGHFEASGVLFASADATEPSADDWKRVKLTATASADGKTVAKPLGDFGALKLDNALKVFLSLQNSASALPAAAVGMIPMSIPEITIAPGTEVSAWLRVVRNGDTNLVDMDIENLPHGIIVSDIGLSGVQIIAGETERKIFFSCARWVPETDRLCHVIHRSGPAKAGEGKPTSSPVLIKVRKSAVERTAGK
ncbi:MAG: hypothetical protein B9S33_21085 [Pedosphaera sp. Tous-C6FEB]|nr:MAG: hypothetical protein B9S33_21085 [Pedosphaera sp. Tous-C6FEB]